MKPLRTPDGSIRRYLLWSLATIILLGWSLSALFNFLHSREQIEELFDAELAQMSRVLQALTADHLTSDPTRLDYQDQQVLAEPFGERESSILGHDYERKLAFQVWSAEGRLLLANHLPLPTDFASVQQGYRMLSLDRHDWYTFSLFDSRHRLWFRVAQRDDVRSELTAEIAWAATLPGLILAPLLLLISALAIGRGLAPLQRISDELKNRDYQNLDPIPPEQYPVELRQPVCELNQLFRRVTESHARERRFTADAAHELRTPLSISKVHLQNVEQLTEDPKVRAYVHAALTGINRLIHLVQQLLTLSRIDAGLEDNTIRPVDLVGVIRDETEALSVLPEFRSCRFRFELPEQHVLHISEAALHIILRNLLDNACRYATHSPEVELSVGAHALLIRNQCAPIADEERDHLFERFKRGQDNKSQGSGLGLAICRELCERSGLTLALRNRDDGVDGVEVELGWAGLRSGSRYSD
jgi:two-component system sensor histidine kinase QseC